MATTVKQREYTLHVDRFNNPAVIEGTDAIKILITRLMLLEPGSDPLHPEMGIGLRNYRFNTGNEGLQLLRDIISKQLEQYLPEFSSSNINLSLDGREHKLTINITVGDTSYIWNSDVNESDYTIKDLI